MNAIIWLSIALIGTVNCAVTWDISEVTVHINELTQAMKWTAIDTIVQLISTKQTNEMMAKSLSSTFMTSYGGNWSAVVGPAGFMSTYTAEPNTVIMYVYKAVQVLLYKPSMAVDLKAVLTNAKTATPKVIWQSETLTTVETQTVIATTKTMLATATSVNDLADKILVDLAAKMTSTQWAVYVGTENDYILDFYGKQFAAIEFRMNSLMIIALKKIM